MTHSLYLSKFDSILGELVLGEIDNHLVMCAFGRESHFETCVEHIERYIDLELEWKNTDFLKNAQSKILSFLSSEINKIEIDYKLIGSSFQKSVWETLLKIEYGKTMSYEEESLLMGKPKGIRAMATANGKNPLSIIIPCHRVIRKDGSLGGYAGGLDVKRKLLKLEGTYHFLL